MSERAIEIPLMSADEYMAFEQESPRKHEFVNGVVYAMVGASDLHGLITVNLSGTLSANLPDSCEVYSSDMKCRIKSKGLDVYYYPDVLVSCDTHDRERHSRKKPILLIEVLSDSTERIDRTEKFDAYRLIPSLAEYVIISQDKRRIEIFRRQSDWQREIVEGDGYLRLDSVDIKLDMDSIYRRVNFERDNADSPTDQS